MSISLQPQRTSPRPFAVNRRLFNRQLIKLILMMLCVIASTYLLRDIHGQNSNSSLSRDR